jgi:hypothetical protein
MSDSGEEEEVEEDECEAAGVVASGVVASECGIALLGFLIYVATPLHPFFVVAKLQYES